MTIQHVDIPDGKIHEPKGISTARLGQVYVATGTSTGTWKVIDTTALAGLSGDGGSDNLRLVSNGANGLVFKRNTAYAAMKIVANTNAIAVTAATDGTLNTNSDYQLVSGTGAPWSAGLSLDATYSGNSLIAGTTGIYRLDISANINGFPTATAKVAFKHRVSGVTFGDIKLLTSANTATDARSVSGSALLSLSQSDYVQLYVASTGTGNLLLSDVAVNLTIVKAS